MCFLLSTHVSCFQLSVHMIWLHLCIAVFLFTQLEHDGSVKPLYATHTHTYTHTHTHTAHDAYNNDNYIKKFKQKSQN